MRIIHNITMSNAGSNSIPFRTGILCMVNIRSIRKHWKNAWTIGYVCHNEDEMRV